MAGSKTGRVTLEYKQGGSPIKADFSPKAIETLTVTEAPATRAGAIKYKLNTLYLVEIRLEM